MKVQFLLVGLVMTCSCSAKSFQNLIWYRNSAITNIIEAPIHQAQFVRVSIGISAQNFYLSKKSPEFTILMSKATLSFKKHKAYHFGIENKTNIIREIKDID